MVAATVSSMRALNSYIYRVVIKLESELNYMPGQYVQVILKCGRTGYFSIASPEKSSRVIELHIADTGKQDGFLKKLKVSDSVAVVGPMGEAWLRSDNSKSVIVLAFGSGYSYARSILLTEANRNSDRRVSFYWAVRSENDFYERDILESLPKRISINLHLLNQESNSLSGIGALLTKLSYTHTCLADHDVYLVGKRDVCLFIRREICEKLGAKSERVYSDSF
ncbi:FAD-binding oxidoreductase [Providencia sp. PROV132]|uniref:FAD-binding oxidoreductase n=1 Tax=Providencia sp. PROV132 TaxID=2949842 RepID=UPI00234AC2C7|nr:FAD-binding oxidoreductase [Providencia sp. PROV132]